MRRRSGLQISCSSLLFLFTGATVSMTEPITRVALPLVAALLLGACASGSTEAQRQAAASKPPPTDCTAWVGTDRNATMGGYLLAQGPKGTGRST
jgi:hypothetical protein